MIAYTSIVKLEVEANGVDGGRTLLDSEALSVTEPLVYTMRSCGLLFSSVRSLVTEPSVYNKRSCFLQYGLW